MNRGAMKQRRAAQSMRAQNAKARNCALALALPPALLVLSALATEMRALEIPRGFLTVGGFVLVGAYFLCRAFATEWRRCAVAVLLYVPTMFGFLVWCAVQLVLRLVK